MKYFPVNLDIAGKKVVVVGAGEVASRKVKSLTACGADVTVVSPAFCRTLSRMKGIKRLKRAYRKGDLKGAFIAISATDSDKVNQRVYQHAVDAGIPVNVVDQPALCTFTVPAVISKRDLLVTISTGGGSPALSRRIRKKIEEDVSRTFADHLALMKEMRPKVLDSPLSPRERKRLFTRMAGREVHDVLEQWGIRAARSLVKSMFLEAVEGRESHAS